MIQIVITDNEGNIRNIPFLYDVLSIGRANDNLIQLMERNISRRHAELIREGNDVFVVDRDSYRGVFLNGERVVRKTRVREHDVVKIGDYEIEIRLLADEDKSLADEETAEFDVPENVPPKLEEVRRKARGEEKATIEEFNTGSEEPTVILDPQTDASRVSQFPSPSEPPEDNVSSERGLKIAERLILALIAAAAVALILYFLS